MTTRRIVVDVAFEAADRWATCRSGGNPTPGLLRALASGPPTGRL
jgi:hypothetical protein